MVLYPDSDDDGWENQFSPQATPPLRSWYIASWYIMVHRIMVHHGTSRYIMVHHAPWPSDHDIAPHPGLTQSCTQGMPASQMPEPKTPQHTGVESLGGFDMPSEPVWEDGDYPSEWGRPEDWAEVDDVQASAISVRQRAAHAQHTGQHMYCRVCTVHCLNGAMQADVYQDRQGGCVPG